MSSKKSEKKRGKSSKKHKDTESRTKHEAAPPQAEPKTVLVIDSDARNWYEVFAGTPGVRVTQVEWEGLVVSATADGRPLCSLRANRRPQANSDAHENRTVQPDIVLIRQLVRGRTLPAEDHTNALLGLLLSGVPAVNTTKAEMQCLEKPVVYRALADIRDRVGAEAFPLIPLTYYSSFSAMRFTIAPPFVVKVGSAEAGYGKLLFRGSGDDSGSAAGFEDFRGCLALHADYATVERFIEDREYDIRVQVIGRHLRAYKRVNANWKGNVGTCLLEEVDVTPQFTAWADEVRQLFGGLDIFTVDAIHTKSGRDYILEINSSASGVAPSNQAVDFGHIRDLVLERLFGAAAPAGGAAASTTTTASTSTSTTTSTSAATTKTADPAKK